MDESRANQIIRSDVMANVTYGGSGVYMEKVNSQNKSCTIHYLNDPSKKADVPLNSLIEH